MKVKEIKYSSHFRRAMKKLPKNLKAEVLERELIFKRNFSDPRLKTHKLNGNLKQFWAFSITDSFRIMFATDGKGVITFVDVDNHGIYS